MNADAADIQRFFEILYPDAEDGYFVLSHPDPAKLTPQGKPALCSDWFDVAHTTWQTIAHAGQRRAQKHNVYFGVALQQPTCTPSQFKRSKNATAYSLPGLWFDLDLAYGQHAASTLPASDAEALDFLASLPAPPSLIVHSGGGLYGYWLFREPYLITSDAERETIIHLSRQFTYTLVTLGKERNWTLDALGDLARVLRPPGTLNYKYGKAVELLHEGAERYNPSEFDWLLKLPPPARTVHAGATITGQPDLVAIAEHYGTSLERKSQTELAGAHPQHGSSTGDNFNVSIERGLWHCWRHGTGGDALALIAVCEGMIPCEDMHPGTLRGETFTRVVALANSTFQAGIALDAAKRRNGHAPPPPQEPNTSAPETTGHEPPLPLSDYTNALAFVRDHGTDLRHCEAWKKWLVWTGSHWSSKAQGPVLQKAKQTIRQLLRRAEHLDDEEYRSWLAHIKRSLSTAALKAMVESAQNEPGISVDYEQLNQQRWLLPCANGTVDLKTGALRPHAREDLLTECLAVPYDAKAPCPRWEAFLWQIMGGSHEPDSPDMGVGTLENRRRADEQATTLIGFLQRLLGVCLTADVREQNIYVFYGKGANGKSTLLGIILALLGHYGMKAAPELLMSSGDHDRHPTERADLFGKRLVAAIETEQGRRLNETLVKELTGGDPIRARRMREDFWEFLPTHKIILATNHKPEVRGTDHAIWRRIKLIPFTVIIPEEQQDPDLPKTLLQELPGILAWMVRGCAAWQQQGLGTPEVVQEATTGYRTEMDRLGAFLTECCVIAEYATVKAPTLTSAYQAWCKRTNEPPLSNTALIETLDERGYKRQRGHANQFYWHGLGLVSTQDEAKESH